MLISFPKISVMFLLRSGGAYVVGSPEEASCCITNELACKTENLLMQKWDEASNGKWGLSSLRSIDANLNSYKITWQKDNRA